MNTQKSKWLLKAVVVAGFLSVFHFRATCAVTINIGAQTLATSGGVAMDVNGLVILVASTTDSTFGGPTALDFVSGDDAVVKTWSLFAGGGGTPGVLSETTGPLTLGSAGISTAWDANDPLAIYWFPTLTLSSTSPGASTSYNTYRDPAPLSGTPNPLDTSARWFTPSDGALAITLVFATIDAGGSNPNSFGHASLTTVPEPAEYGVVAAGVCLLAALVRRKFRSASRDPFRDLRAPCAD